MKKADRASEKMLLRELKTTHDVEHDLVVVFITTIVRNLQTDCRVSDFSLKLCFESLRSFVS
jgi:hypothetical protein